MAWVFNPFTGTFDFTNTGGGGSPGGSSGQVQYNNGGSFGGMSGTTWTDASQSLAIASTGTGTGVTTSSPVLNLSQTWNDGAGGTVTFTGLKFNATDTASASGSLLLDLQVGGTSKFRITKGGGIVFDTGAAVDTTTASGNLTLSAGAGTAQINLYTNGGTRWYVQGSSPYGLVSQSQGGIFAIGRITFGASNDVVLERAAAATLQLGAADTSASATVTITIATPGVVTWSSHGLSTGTPVIFSTTGALPTGITAGTTYYVIAVDANTFQIATSYANATAVSPTAVTTSGSQSGTHTGRRGAVDQVFRVQSASGTLDFPGADFAIQGSRGTGTGAGGSIIFQLAPAGSSGTAQNAYAQRFSVGLTSASVAASTSTAALGVHLLHAGRIIVNNGAVNGSFDPATWKWPSTASIGFASTGDGNGSSLDTILARDAANTLALRNGTSAQTFRVYNSFDGTVGGNNEYGTFDWSTTSNVLTIGSVKTGTGIARNTNIISAGRLSFIQNSSEYIAIARGTNAPGVWIDLGNASFNFRLGSNVAFGWSSAADASNNLDTILARGAAGVIGIGGTTSSFPALKRSSATLQVRLADDTAFAPLSCGNTTASGTALDVSGTGAASIFNVVNTTTGTLLSVVNSSSSTIFSVNDAAATGVQVAGISFGLTGNISAAAWTTSGIRYRNVAATLTDTSSSGTVATAYTDVFGGNTIAASSSTTYTNYATFRLAGPTAGTNVTFTNSWALSLGGSLVMDDATNIAVGTTTGTKIGTATSQKLGFFNATPVVQQAVTTDLLDSIQALGLVASGAGDTPLNLSGGALTCGAITTAGNMLFTDNAYDIGAAAATRPRTIYASGGVSHAAPSTKTGDYSQGANDYSLIFNGTGSITLTLLAAATYPGKILYVKTIAAQTVVSASSNVKPIDNDTAGTAILAATAGKWAMLQSDGTNWVIMAQG